MSAQQRRPPARRPPHRRPRRLPARVYWVRRLLVLGVAVALVWATANLLGDSGGHTRQAAAQQDGGASRTTPPPTARPTTGPAHGPATGGQGQAGGEDPRPGGTTRPQVVPTRLLPADGGCLAADVAVTPSVPGHPRSGGEVALALSVTTVGGTACRLELGPQVLALKVSTGGQQVWDTVQCPGAVPERTAVLRPGWTTAVTVTWPGVYGDKGCTGTTEDAPPGAYALEAAVYEGEPGRADFELRPPAQPADDRPRGHDHGPGPDSGPDNGPDNGPDSGPDNGPASGQT